MISNQANSESKLTTARLQKQPLLPPKVQNAAPINELIKEKRGRIESPESLSKSESPKDKTIKVNSPKVDSPKIVNLSTNDELLTKLDSPTKDKAPRKDESTKKDKPQRKDDSPKVNTPQVNNSKKVVQPTSNDTKSTNIPGYLRPRKKEKRVRSRTPPKRGTTALRTIPRNKSPIRSTRTNTGGTEKQSSDQEVGEKKKFILSPNSQKRSERQNRPSFQGLSVIEGKRKKERSSKEKDDKIELEKAERRRKSLNFMSKSAQSEQIREMLESTMNGYDMTAFVVEGTAEERLQSVMTKAKESGMEPENIFSFFNGGNPNTTHITKEKFLDSLEKIGNTFVVVTDEELIKIVKKFDRNNDGFISIDEFKNYCYEIPSVAWKAERTRLERSGEMKKLKAQLSRRFTLSDVDNKHACGYEVHKTKKFFWKSNNNVDVRLFHCESLNVITVQLYCQTTEEELPSIYVCKNKIEYQIQNMDQEVEKIMNSSENQNNIENFEERKKKATWEIISKYIISRLKLKIHSEIAEEEEVIPERECAHISNKAECIPFLCKLTGDTFDTLMIQKPLNLKPPPSMEPNNTNPFDFEGKMASFRKEARRARASRQSAQGLTDLVSSALSEVDIALDDL